MRARHLRKLGGFSLGIAVLVVAMACTCAGQQTEIQNLVTNGNLAGMRWPNFNDYRTSVEKFYQPTGFAPAWVREPNRYRRPCR